ncbi:MAG: hypothetical protein HQ568_03840 [Calditrichaeota bacterium]|nr:hypothetical protein [Calditrichota bacterium]
MAVEHWMMFGNFAAQRHFVYPSQDAYDGVIINGNMAAYAPAGLAGFLLEKTANLKYIIDPLTHAFQHDPAMITNNEGEVKKSIRTLADAYGEPFISSAGVTPVTPDQLIDEVVLDDVVNNCLRFQNTILAQRILESDAMKYIDSDEVIAEPYALVTPYFFMSESTYRDWLEVMVRAINVAADSGEWSSKRIFGAIVLSRAILINEPAIDYITNRLRDINIDGFLVWVDNFYELEVGEVELRGMLRLCESLRQNKTKEVINLHGSYFSILAASNLGGEKLTGVTHGPEFGEHRNVVPVGGGIPIARYYIPELHARIRYRDALRYFNRLGWLESAKSFHDNVCRCPKCLEIIDGDPANFTIFGESNPKEVRRGFGIVTIDYPTRDTIVNCLEHYLQRKNIEYVKASTTSGSELLEDLVRAQSVYGEILGVDGVNYLDVWSNIFRSMRGETWE